MRTEDREDSLEGNRLRREDSSGNRFISEREDPHAEESPEENDEWNFLAKLTTNSKLTRTTTTIEATNPE